MLLLNLDMTGPAERMLVNGSRGVVIGFVPKAVRTSFIAIRSCRRICQRQCQVCPWHVLLLWYDDRLSPVQQHWQSCSLLKCMLYPTGGLSASVEVQSRTRSTLLLLDFESQLSAVIMQS